jgi:predicted TIM-barrel fold metal-dependent hydrolase
MTGGQADVPSQAQHGTVDVHAHYLPERYRTVARYHGHGQPDGMPALPEWSAETHIELMDRLGVRMAVNEVAAATIASHPGRFGGFASLPLPDVDAAVAEVGHALDTLGLDGVVLMTNVRGTYLGDASLDPLFDELDRRSAVVFVHPTSPPCWEQLSLGVPRPMIEFPFDSTRAVANLLLSGTLARCPNLQLVVPHAGGAVPVLAGRIVGMGAMVRGLDPGSLVAILRGLWYDLAGPVVPGALAAVETLADPGRLLFGSDYPFTPAPIVEQAVHGLATMLTADQLAQLADNAGRLLARARA